MNILRNIFAVVLGLLIGGSVNMLIIMNSDSIVSLPEGIDPSDMESLVENMHLFQPINYLPPFLAHALGTLVGAFVASFIAASHRMYFALAIGVIFLVGGIMMAMDLPSPIWFDAADIILAYIPMAWVGWKLAGGK